MYVCLYVYVCMYVCTYVRMHVCMYVLEDQSINQSTCLQGTGEWFIPFIIYPAKKKKNKKKKLMEIIDK